MALYSKSVLSSILRHVTNAGRMASFIRQAKPAIALTTTNRNYHVLRPQKHKQHTLSPPITPHSLTCSCGCSALHSKGDKELTEFLAEEIAAEIKSQKFPKLPSLEGFKVTTTGSDISLEKNFNNETVKIFLNVNHTVDTDPPEAEVGLNQDDVETGEMKSKPNFKVEFIKGGKVLEFGCTIVDDGNSEHAEDPEAYNDVFNIDEVSIYDEGTKLEHTYAVSGEIMDGYLYDMLMNMLEERGVSNEFVKKLIDYCTSYEHKLYIGFLEGIKSFVSSK